MRTIRPFQIFEKLNGNRDIKYHIPEVSGTESETVRSIETLLLIAVARIVRPSTLLEFGTAYGYSALHLAMNTEAAITTVDIRQRPNPVWNGHKVSAVECDIYAMQPTPADMVFCDINYSTESIRRCTELAFAANPQVIAWHDYRNPKEPHTEAFLDALPHDLVHVEDTWLVFWFQHQLIP